MRRLIWGAGFRYTWIGSCWHGEAGGSLTKSQVLSEWLVKHIWLSLAGSVFDLRANYKELQLLTK